MSLPWQFRPWHTARKLREANANQRGIILAQQAVGEELRTELREARAQIRLLTEKEVCDPPDWVIMGKRDDEGLMVLGSHRPAHAEVTRQAVGFLTSPIPSPIPSRRRPMIPVYENRVLFTSPDFTVIRCERYREGVQSLMGEWDREGGDAR